MYRRCILLVKWCLTSRCIIWSLTHDAKCWGYWTTGYRFAWPWAFDNFVVTDWIHRLCSKLVRCRFINGSFMPMYIFVLFSALLLEVKFYEIVVLIFQVLVILSTITLFFIVVWVFWERFYCLIDNCGISVRKFWCIYFDIVWTWAFTSSVIFMLRAVASFGWLSSLSSMEENFIVLKTVGVNYSSAWILTWILDGSH
jgi:hypothetical protein